MAAAQCWILIAAFIWLSLVECQSRTDLNSITTTKHEALGFLKRRFKRGLTEECREGCSIEEVYEIYNNYDRSYVYMTDYKCSKISCPAGCYALNKDFSHSDKLTVACYPHCDLKGNPQACEIYYTTDVQITRGGDIRQGTGECISVDVCSQCNEGFYGGDKYCYMCGKIDHCNYRKCGDKNTNLICAWCDGEIADRIYWRAYTGNLDNRLSCQKTCSWRTDSTRCYPGTCASELAANCVCAPNFSGTHCEEITDEPPILENHAIFYDNEIRKLVKIENDPNFVQDNHPIIWSNFKMFDVVKTKMTAKYLQPNIGLDPDHYVRDFKVGLIEMKTTLSLYRGGSLISSKEQLCRTMDKYQPVDQLECLQSFSIGSYSGPSWLPLHHDDKIIYKVSATNGGFVNVQNRDKVPLNIINKYFYSGKTKTREFEYHWDLQTPYHCSETSASCSSFLSIASDITSDPTISFTWDGWADDLSGISHYEYQLFDLVSQASGLQDGAVLKSSGQLPSSPNSFSLKVTEPGVYSIHISAFDLAGNEKTGRGIFFFDDKSVVTLHGEKTKCVTASKETSYEWVVQDTNTIKIVWLDRFFNVRHKNNRWLNPVLNMASQIAAIYEDLYGNRTNKAINNVHGIVSFKISYELFDTALKSSRPLTSLPSSQLTDQTETLTINWADGDKLIVTVQAFDVIGTYNTETITVYRDASPPVIENLWLTKGDRLNVSVHSIEDFNKMTIEWVAYDDHSGLDTVYWKLYDSYGTYIEHGHEDIVAQGLANNLAECQLKYGSYPRGANCYCTNFVGCYHRHFQVKPEIKAQGGLKLNLDRGVHDSDYYIEIAVKNKAMITTKSTKKITIDTSPPHAGVVHDGIQGNPEIDYQQGRNLEAYWDQFFDRESGVFFYQYIVGTTCATKNNFDLSRTNPNVVETYNTYGSYTASSDGTFYFTVVAYNRALEPSVPVCSDGVTIDSSVPRVKEVIVKDSLVTGGLVTDSTRTNYFILGSDRVRRLIPNPTADCVNRATTLNNIDLYPLQRHANKSAMEVDGNAFCSNSSGAPASIGLSLFKSSLMELSWEPIDIPSKVYDYQVGFSSTAGSAAPDIMPFESTKQHAHHRVMHGNIPDGTRFFIIIKTISKSNVEGITTLGPCFMDTTPPDFTGSITVSLVGDYLVASWPPNAFSDSEELFDMKYQFSIGHLEYGSQVQNYKPLKGGATCTLSVSPTCTAVKISELEWNLHGHHTYYINIKATNTAGLTRIQASDPYIHDVQLPAEGVVLDIDTQMFPTDIPLKDIEDIDFQTDVTSMAARWSGFAHPHLDVTYKISIGRTKGGSDVISMKDVGTSLSHKATGLSLIPYQKYYWTVIAVSSAGNTIVTSDGVTIVTENDVLPSVTIYDGQPCNQTGLVVAHHQDDNRIVCTDDIDVQMSLNSLKAYWTVPVNIQSYTTDAFIAIEKRSTVGNVWSLYRGYRHVSTVFDVSIDDLTLSPGIMYRIVLKLCAKMICFQPIPTDGVMIMANPPVSGGLTVEHLNTSMTGGAEKLMVTIDTFYDPDIEDVSEKNDAIEKYEYAITDNSINGKMYTIWKSLVTFTTNGNKISFQLQLNGTMDFSRCKRLSVRGYNKVKLVSTVSAEIKDCSAFNPILINPNIVIDAVAEGIGKPVFLTKNDRWTSPDQDYTPHKDIISAVWPSLRHRNYKYAIINAKTVDVTTYYKQINQLKLVDPCSHPDAIRCGTTINEFMNEKFSNNELVHGTRYTVCLHADRKLIQHETWIEDLQAINTCSDGIIVDLTPPIEGRLWIGINPKTYFQTSTSDMYVNWDGFLDVEEEHVGPHASGIKEYILGIGTTREGNDVHAFENVGVVQHKALHRLNLQNGYQYYATLKAVDFANRTTIAVSEAITVDATPPARSNKPITISNRHITSRTEINPCWKDVFTDLESGIDYYMWSIGSEPGYTDMMPYVKVVGEECGETDENNPLDLKDGHYYYINVRAFNKAGLSSLATSWAFQVETTPPTAGHVYDGAVSQLTGSLKDIDFQTETKVLNACWEGFHESHSTITEYYVSVGTCPQCEDILPEQAVGITNAFTLKNIHLGSGLRYYITVTACNTAYMCTTVTSDGVIIDNSPPTVGAVQDGVGFYDTEYQSMITYISSKWYGFDDPQSGLERYVWRAGTTKGGSNIVPETQLHLTDTASLYNATLGLPVNKRIYVTVRAYNKAGLWSESFSNGFLVDNTPPVVTKQPMFSQDFGIMGLTQIYRTSMKIEWAVNDAESFIKRQYLSIKSHIGGEFMLSSLPVNGIARSYVFTGLDLHDGVTYYVTLISCNSAEICTTSTSPGMFVDSTPPSRGMFAIQTDHAVDPELARNSNGWMTWSRNALYLAWLGFSDVHSNIDHYRVHIGSTYMGNDLNKEESKRYSHTTTNTNHGDEGYVQQFTVDTESLLNYNTLFITVWAVNGVGLRSNLIHSAFKRVPGGALDLIRRCNAMSCEGHCVCAPQDQKCSYVPTIGQCTDISANNVNNLLLVEDSNGYSTKDQTVTASDNVLRGMWLVSQRQGLKPLWFEWSVGYSSSNTPIGIFNLVDELVWQDGGQLMDAVFCTKQGVRLHNTLSYAVFVRVWYSSNNYAIFKSNGIFVMGQAPALANTRGKTVIEKVQGTTVKDIDYMQIGRPIIFDWSGKFLEAKETIEKYDIYLSTFPGGHDIMPVTTGLPGIETGYNMSGIKLAPGVVHYTNVIAYNYAGSHTTATSDGFTIDSTNPTVGIVYDGLGRHDMEYKNSSHSVEAHWHGFTDSESGIKNYHWCVGTTSAKDRKPEKTECSIMGWVNVGLHVSVSRNVSFHLTEDMKIYNKVYATDNAGLTSEIVVSDGAIVDATPPVPRKFVHIDDNIVDNPSFEGTGGGEIKWQDVSTTDICMVPSSYHPLSWIPTSLTCMAVVTSDVNLAKDGRSLLFIRGSIYQQLSKVTSGKMYRISFFSSHLPILESVSSNKEGFVQFGESTKQVFLIYTKTYRLDGHGESIGREEISWHSHTFYFIATENMANITIGSMDITTGILIDDLSVQEVNLTMGHISGHVNGHIVFLHEWSSIHGSWDFIDPESPITDYAWAIGYSAGGTQIQPFRSVGLMNFGMNNKVTLVHNTYIYVTAVATNAAGLQGISYSDPILVDLTPPNIKFVFDGRGDDEDAWIFDEVSANWEMEDLESGIKWCKWAIGYKPGSTELLNYTVITTKSGYRDYDYSVLLGHVIYTTLTCENNAGLSSTKSSDGVRISNLPPSTSTAEVEIIPVTSTEYNSREGFQGVTNTMKIKWSGFTDSIGVETYQVNYQDTKSESMFFPANQEMLYTHFTKMSMTDSVQTIGLQAMNKLFLKSSSVFTNISVDATPPQINAAKKLGIAWINQNVVVSWNDVFRSNNHLYYEVSAGSYEAGCNIVQWQFTNQTSVTFGIPPSVRAEAGLNIYVIVRAISVGGFYAQKDGKITLS